MDQFDGWKNSFISNLFNLSLCGTDFYMSNWRHKGELKKDCAVINQKLDYHIAHAKMQRYRLIAMSHINKYSYEKSIYGGH